MRKPAEDQLPLELPEEERAAPPPRSKRRRFPTPPATDRRAPKRTRAVSAALLQAPVGACCGFCGQKLTILREVAICPSCGSIVGRDDETAGAADERG